MECNSCWSVLNVSCEKSVEGAMRPRWLRGYWAGSHHILSGNIWILRMFDPFTMHHTRVVSLLVIKKVCSNVYPWTRAGYLGLSLPVLDACSQRMSWDVERKPNATTTVHMTAQQTLPFSIITKASMFCCAYASGVYYFIMSILFIILRTKRGIFYIISPSD